MFRPRLSHLQQPWPFGLTRRNWPVFIIGLVVVLALVLQLDGSLSRWGQALPENVRRFFYFVTDFGLSDWILVPSLLLSIVFALLGLALARRRIGRAAGQVAQISAFIFVTVGFPGLFTAVFKRLLGRGRPETLDSSGILGFQHLINDHSFQSFPSGHTTTAFALAYAVGFLWPKAFWPVLALAVAVGVSRVVVGAHFPTDVLAGVAVGTLLAYSVRNVFARRGWLFRVDEDGLVRRRPFTALRRLAQRRPR
jgi:membrane-associated phospholipid phosphatase